MPNRLRTTPIRAPLSASARRPARYDAGICPALADVDGVGRIGADRRVEHDGQVGDGARDRPADVLRARERHDAGAAGQSLRAAQADQIVVRGRNANRSAGVAAHAARGEVRRDGGARSAARTAGIAIEIVGVLRLPEARADGDDSGRELVHVRLAEDDGAGGLEPLHQKRVARGME